MPSFFQTTAPFPFATIALAVTSLFVIVAMVTKAMRSRRRTVWQQFGRRHHMAFDEVSDGPRLVGEVDHMHCVLETLADGSDTGPMGVEVVAMSLKYANGEDGNEQMPDSLAVESAVGSVGHVQSALTPNRVITGDEKFDQEMLTVSRDQSAAMRWLTPRRRSALLELALYHRDKETICHPGRLVLRTRSAISRLRDLEEMLTSLRTAADIIQRPATD